MSDKSIIRTVKSKDNPFVMIDKTFLSDERLSWKAKGLLAYFLSKPDDWRILVTDLMNQSTDGEKAVRSGLKELETYGYLENNPVKDEKGRIKYWEKIVYERPKTPDNTDPSPDSQNGNVEPHSQNGNLESPHADFLHVENVQVENLHVENAGLLINDNTNNKLTKNDRVVVEELERKVFLIYESFRINGIHITKEKVREWIVDKQYDAAVIHQILVDTMDKVSSNSLSEPIRDFVAWMEGVLRKGYVRPTQIKTIKHIRQEKYGLM